MTYLVDANVLSELRKGERCAPGVIEWFAGVDDDEIFLSVLVIGEIQRGGRSHPSPGSARGQCPCAVAGECDEHVR